MEIAGERDPTPPTLGSKGLINRTHFIRIIIQSLYSLGYTKAASMLESESSVHLDSPEFASILRHVIAGRWPDCIAAVDSIDGLDASARSTASFLIWKEHFLELLGSGEGAMAAIDVLWDQISPLDLDRSRVHRLARELISTRGAAVSAENRARRRMALLLDLVEVLPDWVRVPDGRLEHLVETAVLRQADSCLYHNSPEKTTLYEDHECGRDHIPSKCSQILYGHKNEVWFVQFSYSGEYLASTSSDCTAIIWKVKEDDIVSLEHVLEGHVRPVSFVSWSPDDTMLLTCGNGEVLKLWDVVTGTCKLTFGGPVSCIINSCAWFPDSEKIVCGSCDPDNRIFTCDLRGKELEVWEGERMPKVSDLALTPDGRHLISVCSNREIWVREFPRGKERAIYEEHAITGLSLSRDGRSLIVNLNNEEIHLWDVEGSSNAPRCFKGHKQGKYVIRSCFGGSSCLFIASGSEDSQVYIWQRHHEKPIQVISGHSMTVNTVSWNPTKPHMLASASDDRTVRIWVASKGRQAKDHT